MPKTAEKRLESPEQMKTTHEGFVLENEGNKGHGLRMEVNWNEAVKPAVKIRFTDEKTGQTYIIDRMELMSAMFAIADEKEQMDFISEQYETVKMRRMLIPLVPKIRMVLEPGEKYYFPADIPITHITGPRTRPLSKKDAAKGASLLKK